MATANLPTARTAAEVLRDAVFWLVLPAAILPAFWGTGFILYQTAIAGRRGSGRVVSTRARRPAVRRS